MLAEDRRNYILRLLESRSSVSVAELSATFSLSEVSVRKLPWRRKDSYGAPGAAR